MRKLMAAGVAAGALVAGLVGCSSSGGSTDVSEPLTAEAAAGEWKLVDGSGPDGPIEPIEDHAVTLQIGEDGAFSGTSGCNNIMGTMAITDGAVDLGPIGQTMMACEDDVMKFEDNYTRALDSVTAGSASADDLALRGEGTELNYKRV